MILRDYQQKLIDDINQSPNKRNCIQLATGGGKTVIFSHLANNYKGRVLILVNRTELIEQTAKNITRSVSLITAKTKRVGSGEVLIGMVESVHNRMKKGLFNLENIDLIIVDEIQNLQFIKVFENYPNRLLGFTATPVTMKKEYYFKCKYCDSKHKTTKECCGKETKKYTLKISLKTWYGELIQGIEISKLIELGFLSPVHNFSCDSSMLDKLKTDSSGEFTNKSQDEVFNNLASTENLIANYKEHCIDKKTMVFNSNIEANNEALKMFQMDGINVRAYDSRSKEKRKEVVEWFRSTPNAVLMSVGVFTTGFDVDDVECIILNKATNSLSLYHQIVGRGGRITDKVFKPYFKLIDLGGNLGRFGSWSDEVNWMKIYNDETEKKTTIRDLEDFIVCYECDSLIKQYPCDVCGAEAPKKEKKSKVVIAKEVNKLPKPKATHILKYAQSNELDINDAKILTSNYILDMFIYAQTAYPTLYENKAYLKSEIQKMLKPIYFALHGSDLIGNRKRTIKDFEKKVFTKINKHYAKK